MSFEPRSPRATTSSSGSSRSISKKKSSLRLLVPLALAFACACGPETLGSPEAAARAAGGRDARVLVLAVDGMDWSVADPMLQRGELPELARLLSQGMRIPLRSRPPTNSPALWTTIATGVRRNRHGVLDFVYLPEGGARQVPASSDTRVVPAFWEILALLERRAVTIGWFVSWPPARVAPGALLTDRWEVAEPGSEGPPLAWPPGLSGATFDPIGLEDLGQEMSAVLDAVEGREPPRRSAVERARRYVATDLARIRAAVALARATRPEVLTLYLQSVDAAGHFFWGVRHPDADPVEAAYRLMDRALGAARGAMGEEAAVLLVSDHGFQPFVQPGSILVRYQLLFEELGLLAQGGDGEVDIASSSLVPGEGTGIVEPLDRRQSLLYFFPGRGPELEEAMDILSGLRTESGRAFFARVEAVRPASAPGVDPPDIVVEVAIDALRDRELVLPSGERLGLGPPLLYSYDDITGTHREEAVLVVRAPGAPPGSTADEPLRPEDVQPLLLHLAGAPLAMDVEGRIPAGLLAQESPAPQWVESYRPWVRRDREPRRGGEAEDAMLERLRSLGYVD